MGLVTAADDMRPRRSVLTDRGLCSLRVYCLQVYLHQQGPA